MENFISTMDCSKLNVGMIVKNYKVMCSLLNESVMSGSSKQYQLRRWKRFFDFDKQGQKFIITEIYETPKEKIDYRRSRPYRPMGGEEHFKVPQELYSSHGIYRIQSGNKVFIGMTKLPFRSKFQEHYNNHSNYYPVTSKLLHMKDGRYEVEYAAKPSDTYLDVNDMYNEIMKQYGNNSNYILLRPSLVKQQPEEDEET